MDRVDVLVVGGGAAGVGAAVGACASGARVRVIERDGVLGGLATAAEVRTVCGQWLRDLDGPIRPAMTGFPADFVDELARAGGTAPVRWRDGLVFLPYAPVDFAAVCDRWVTPAETSLHTTLVALARDGDGFVATLLASDRLETLRAATVVDASGVAWAAAAAGASSLPEEPRQAASLVITLGGLPPLDEAALRLWLGKETVRLGPAPSGLSVVPGSLDRGRASFKVTLPPQDQDAPGALGRMERLARAEARRWAAWMAAQPELAGAHLLSEAARLGVRTGRRPLGMVVVNGAHVLAAASHPQGVARAAWPIERWQSARQPTMGLPPPGAACEVPAGALISADVPGLFFAGRALSADEEAVASLRVIGTCLATGYAAGALAAGQVGRTPLAESVARIRALQMGLP